MYVHAPGIRIAQDPIPAERGQGRLCTLKETAEDDVADRDLRYRVPELLEPAGDVNPGELEPADDD